MVKLVVHGDARATCVQRVLILLEELELKYDFKNVDLMKEEQKREVFLEMQPFGKVPVVEYGDKKLFESRAILRYIARNNKDPDFYPDVYTDVWLEAEAHNFNPCVSKVVYEKMFKEWRGEQADSKVVEEALVEVSKVLDVYNMHLEKHKYIAGDQYTIADMSHIPYAYYFLKCGYKDILKARPAVYEWLKDIIRRPAVRRVLDGNFGE